MTSLPILDTAACCTPETAASLSAGDAAAVRPLSAGDAATVRPLSAGDAATVRPLSAGDADRLSVTFKALSDPTRLRLLSIIAASEGQEACVCDLTEPVGLSQPTVSHHLKVLTEAGFVSRSKRGTWAFYRLLPKALGVVEHVLGSDLRGSVRA